MKFLFAFLLGGTIPLLGQLLLDNTKLTPGHITSLFTVSGALLSFFGIYQRLIDLAGAGATMMISNFGHLLYQGGIEGYHNYQILGLFSGPLQKGGVAIVAAIICAFVFLVFFKPKD